MELLVLGPLEVRHGALPTVLTGAKARELLTLLALRPNRPVAADVLIDELWEGRPPRTAQSALRVHIWHVRRALESSESEEPEPRVVLGSGGYVLQVATAELDSLHFESLLRQGRDASLRGAAHVAEETLKAALACWRGPALVDARHLAGCAAEAERLEQLRLSAVDEYAQVSLSLNNNAAVVELLADVVRDFPLHESLIGHLMVALYRCGRPAEALQTFARLKEQLAGFGLTPSGELRRLETDILLERRNLAFVGGAVVAGSVPAPLTRMVGRGPELERLLGVHELAAGGARRLVLLSGPAGIGKSTLATAYAERARNNGSVVLVGRCASDTPEYRAVREVLVAALPLLEESAREKLAGDLRVLVGDPEATPYRASDLHESDSDRASEHLLLLEAIAATIASLGARPAVLVVEDLHESDHATLVVLRHLLRHESLAHLLVVATYRDDEVGMTVEEEIAALAPPTSTERIRLAGFDDHEVRALIRATERSEVTSPLLEVANLLRETTDGNPFHVRALLGELAEQSWALDDRAGLERTISTLAPDGVRALMNRRVNRLSSEAQLVIRAAATLGQAISNEMLVRICGLPDRVVMEAVNEILDGHLLREHEWLVGRYEFPHSLVRNSVYLGTPDDERARLHHCVAEALEAPDVDVRRPRESAELAHHFASARTVGSAAKAADYSCLAGDEAMTRLAFTEATEWYERALVHWLDAGRPECETGALCLSLGRAYEADREFVTARQRYLAGAVHARTAGDLVLFADLAIAATGPWSSGRDFQDDAREVLEAAVATSDTLDPFQRVRLLARLATSLYYDDPVREAALADEARALAETLADDTVLAEAHLARHLSLTHEPTARVERLTTSEVALGLATSTGSAPAMLRVGRELLTDLLENGECERFDAALDGYEGLAKQACSPYDLYWSMALRATQATLYGDLSLAEQLARGAGILGAELHEDAVGLEMLQQFVVRYQQGRLVELVRPLRAIEAPRPAYRAGSALAAIACAEAGRLDDADHIARWAMGPDGKAIGRDTFWLGAHALFAGAVSATGNDELTRSLYESLLPCADHVVTFGAGGAVLGCTHHWLGLLARALGDFDAAAAHLREAEVISARIGAPYWRAQAQCDLAEALRRRGNAADAAEAEKLTHEASTVAAQKGFGRLAVGNA